MNFIFLIVLMLLPVSLQAASVYEEGISLVVLAHEGLRKMILPEEMRSASSFTLVVHPRTGKTQPPFGPGGGGAGGGGSAGNSQGTSIKEGAGTGGPPQSVNSLLYRANQLFNKKKFPEAMSAVETAESMEPNNAKVKTMKGSLFLMMGYKESAAEAWAESLKLNPEQPDLKAQLDKLNIEVKPNKPVPETEEPPTKP